MLAILQIFLFMVAGALADFRYKSYQHSITCYAQHAPKAPRSLEEVQEVVQYAIRYNVPIKPVGARHSISDNICTTGIPVNMTHIRHYSYNPKTQTATVGAGMEVGDFLEKLHQYGRTVTGYPDYGGVTVGGAVATGSHGTALKHPSTLSQQVVAMTVVNGRGQILKITRDEEEFKAWSVNLGLLGIVYELEFETQKQFKLQITHTPIPDNVLRNGTDLAKIAKEHDHFQLWWFPTSATIVVATGDRIPVHEPGNCETRLVPEVSWFTENAISTGLEVFQATRDDVTMFNVQNYVMMTLYKVMPGTEPFFVEEDGETACIEEIIGYGHRLTNNKCQECAWQWRDDLVTNEDLEIAIPVHKLMPALRTLGEVFDKQLTHFPVRGLRARVLKKGDAWMGFNEGDHDWAAIEWLTVPRWDKSMPKMGISAYQAMGQILVEQYGGRPHWAKGGFYYSNPRIIRKAHKNLDKFIEAMNEHDPQEIFMNTFGERVKYGEERYTVSAEMESHCALNEVCVCKNNRDCGNEGLLDYSCTSFPGFPAYNVCAPGALENMKEAYTRQLIGLMSTLDYNGEESVIQYLRQFTVFNDLLVNKKHNQQRLTEEQQEKRGWNLNFLKAFN